MATDRLPYPDPTGTQAAANVDRERTLANGDDPDIAHSLAEAILPPPKPFYLDTAGARTSSGGRTAIPPFREVGPYGLVPDAPLTNDQVVIAIMQLAPIMTRRAA